MQVNLSFVSAVIVGIYPLSIWMGGGVSYYAVAFAVLFTVLILRNRGLSLRRSDLRATLPLWLMSAAFFLSASWAIDWAHTLYHALKFFAFLVLAVLIGSQIRADAPRKLAHISAISSVIVLITFLMTFAKYGSIRFVPEYAHDVIGAFSNFGGAILVLSLPFLMERATSSRHRLLYIFIIGCSLVGLVLSGSRAGLVLSVLYLAFFLIRTAFTKRGHAAGIKTIMAAAITITTLGIFIYFYGKTEGELSSAMMVAVDRLNESTDADTNNDSLRAVAFYELLNIGVNNFPFGIGYQNFQLYMDERYSEAIVSHSFITTMLGEIGALGLLVFIYFSYSMFNKIRGLSRLNIWPSHFYEALSASAILGFVHWTVRPELDNLLFIVIVVILFLAKSTNITSPVQSGAKTQDV